MALRYLAEPEACIAQDSLLSSATDYGTSLLLLIGPNGWSVLSAAAAKSLQSCPLLCNPRDGNPPGSPVPGILQARALEWVAISLSNAWKWKVKVKLLSHVRLLATPWTAAFQAPPSMGFSRQEYWSGVPLPSPIHKGLESRYFSLVGHTVSSFLLI